jgi:lambda family phage portal protein
MAMRTSSIVDSRGQPLVVREGPGGARAGVALPDGTTTVSGLGGAAFPYDAAAFATQEMGNWLPQIRSPDAEINWYRDRMVARSRDLARNSGWAAGGITRILDNTIGTQLRLRSTPDHRALAQLTGIKAFDAEWANEYRKAVESLWRNYCNHPDRWNDVTRQLTFGQQMRVAMRHKLVDGEGLMLTYWLPERVAPGCARFATSFMLVDPDRLSNPWQMIDSKYMRNGVELDDYGVAIAYHIREAEQNDMYAAIEANRWERVPREDEDGFRRVIHDFDTDRAGQHRGVGIFIPILGHMKMLAAYYQVELQQAVIAATFGTYVTSPADPEVVAGALGGDVGDGMDLPMYQDLRLAWSQQHPAMLNGARVPQLFPGEKIESVDSKHPHANFDAFAREMLCVFASATGVSVEQVTQDWSKTNYASARAALMETWKALMRRRGDFASNTATPAYSTWLQEAHESGMLDHVLPNGAPPYVEFKAEYSRCMWLGPARGWVDPTKEPQGAMLRMQSATSTLAAECAEQGEDWEEVLDQRELELKALDDRGIPRPQWGVEIGGGPEEAGSHDKNSPNYQPDA